MRLPAVAAVRPEWPKRSLEGWEKLRDRARRFESAVGGGDAFEAMLAELRSMAATARFEGLRDLLRRRLAARALTWLWLDGDVEVLRLLNPAMLDALLEAQKPRLTRITFLQLVQLYFRRFDLLDSTERESVAGMRSVLESQLYWQLAEMPASRGLGTAPDAVSALKREAHWLLGVDGPRNLAVRTRAAGQELSTAFSRLGLGGFDVGRYGDICRACFYLERLRELPVGESDEVFDELLKPSVAKVRFEGERRIGHAALEILIDRSGNEPGEAWQNFILNLAGDPRIASTARNYQEWWRPLGDERIQRVRGWLSKEDLKLFLGAVQQYGKEERNLELQRMFPARKVFLEGLFRLGLIRNTRLMLGNKALASVRRILSQEVKTNFASLEGPMADKAVIYLDCGDFCLVEGSHSFKIWVYLAPPGRVLLSYEKSSFSHWELTGGLQGEYKKSYPKLPHQAVVHTAMWQRKVFDFLGSNGIAIDIEQLLSKQDYKIYLRNYGLPVVARKPRHVPAVQVTEPEPERLLRPDGQSASVEFAASVRDQQALMAQQPARHGIVRQNQEDLGGEYALSVTDVAMLTFLSANPGSTVKQLADGMFSPGMSPNAVQAMLRHRNLREFTRCVGSRYWSLSERGAAFVGTGGQRDSKVQEVVDPGASVRGLELLDAFELKVLRFLASHPGEKVRRASIALGVEATEINRVLYGKLKSLCIQAKDYGWTVRPGVIEALDGLRRT